MILEALSVLSCLSGIGEISESPFIVPVAGCFMIAVIVIASTAAATRKREIESQERLAAIAKGIMPPPTHAELEMTRVQPVSNATRRYTNIRLAGIILVGGALGVILFFCILSSILGERDVLAGAAAGLVPLGLGIGFLIDANLQKRALDGPPAN
jgi:small-conductance mechanosensitive channel